MTIKDELIRAAAKKYNMPEKTILAIVSHQFDGAHAATMLNNSIEISGFGKFIFNNKRGLKQMKKYESQYALFSTSLENPELSSTERRNIEMKLNTVLLNIKHLKPKLKNETK